MSTLHPHPSSGNRLVSHFKGKSVTYTSHRSQRHPVAHSISVTIKLLVRTWDLFHLYHGFSNIDNRDKLYAHFAYSLGMPWMILEMKSQVTPYTKGCLICPGLLELSSLTSSCRFSETCLEWWMFFVWCKLSASLSAEEAGAPDLLPSAVSHWVYFTFIAAMSKLKL